MSNHIRSLLARQQLMADRTNPTAAPYLYGDVVSYDPVKHMVRVQIDNAFDVQGAMQKSEPVTMPLLTPFIGNGYGMQWSPEAGTQVLILQSRDGDQPVALAFASTVNSVPPNPSILTGEWEVANKTNPLVKIRSAADGTMQLGNIATITGSLNNGARKKDLNILVTAINALVIALNTHTHSGVTTGSGVSGAPSSTFTAFTTPSGSTTLRIGD